LKELGSFSWHPADLEEVKAAGTYTNNHWIKLESHWHMQTNKGTSFSELATLEKHLIQCQILEHETAGDPNLLNWQPVHRFQQIRLTLG
jgi:hypothetical protein